MKLISSWSGGKDSCYALMQALKEQPSTLAVLLTMMNESGKVSRSHGIAQSLLAQQAHALSVPLSLVAATWHDYEAQFISTLKQLKHTYHTHAVVFGDIDIQPHRAWEEKVCAASQQQAVLPLWQQDRKALVHAMIDSGIHAIITSCHADLGESFLGRTLSKDLVAEMEEKGVDVCGENGEYHTLVLDCPLFASAITLPEYKKQRHENYWFLTW